MQMERGRRRAPGRVGRCPFWNNCLRAGGRGQGTCWPLLTHPRPPPPQGVPSGGGAVLQGHPDTCVPGGQRGGGHCPRPRAPVSHAGGFMADLVSAASLWASPWATLGGTRAEGSPLAVALQPYGSEDLGASPTCTFALSSLLPGLRRLGEGGGGMCGCVFESKLYYVVIL